MASIEAPAARRVNPYIHSLLLFGLDECSYPKILLDDCLQLFFSLNELVLHSPEPFRVADYVIFAKEKRMFPRIEVKPERAFFPFPGAGAGAEHASGAPIRQEPESVAAAKRATRDKRG